MTDGVVFASDAATTEQIAAHLYECDARFVPALTSRVDIAGYALKLAIVARRFEAWSDGKLVGLLAAYMNDTERHEAFITTVSVVTAYAGMGIAGRLLQDCLQAARMKRFERVSLDVSPGNAVAIRLYERCGFSRVDAPTAAAARMSIDLTDPRWKQ